MARSLHPVRAVVVVVVVVRVVVEVAVHRLKARRQRQLQHAGKMRQRWAPTLYRPRLEAPRTPRQLEAAGVEPAAEPAVELLLLGVSPTGPVMPHILHEFL
jgi:hypothetical protein